MNTLVLAPFSRSQLTILEAFGRVVYEPWTISQLIYEPEELGIRINREGFEAVIVEADFMFDELFQVAPKLAFIGLCRSALNQVDIESATDHQVVVVHTPGRNAQAVAELVLGLMFNLARHISPASAHVAARQWQSPLDTSNFFQGSELSGKTIGIIGLGEIGIRVARLANGIGMRVIGYDPYAKLAVSSREIVQLVSFETLLQRCDFLSIHVPDNPGTRSIINARNLRLMQPTSYIINVSSPYAIESGALSESLRAGSIAGAAIDVHEGHPIPPDSAYLTAPNVLLTPHIGGATRETIFRHSKMITKDIQRFLTGKKPLHLANPGVWPMEKSKEAY